MGRRAKPVALHVAQGNPNRLTKGEIERRKKSEIKLGDNKLTPPTFVKNDVIAYAKWKEISKLYKDVDFVSSGDAGLLARYCMTFSEYQSLLEHRQTISDIGRKFYEAVEQMEEEIGEAKTARLIQKVEYLTSVGGLLTIENAINKKMDMLIKMEDRLFLNPLAKVKNVPKKEPEKKKDPLAERGFGNV